MRASKFSALFLTAAMALGVVHQAEALDADDRKQFSQMEQSIAQEHQVEVGRAKYVLNREDPSRMKVLCVKFTLSATASANGSRKGYILISDNMDDTKATIEMVYAKLNNARPYDPRNAGTLPDGVSSESNLAQLIKQGSEIGDGVMVHGQSVKRQPDGSEKVVGLMTVMANLSENQIGILVTSDDGVTRLDKVVAIDLKYQGLPNLLARNNNAVAQLNKP